MIGISDRCGKDFCFKTLYTKNLCNLLNKLNTVPAAVVDAANKWRNISGACFGRQYGLAGRKYKGAVCFDAVIGKPFDGFDILLLS